MLSNTNKSANSIPNESKSDFIVDILSSDSTVNRIIKSSSHVTSIIIPYANDIISYAFLNPKEVVANKINPKLCENATKIVESNNNTIKSKILKTNKFQEAVRFFLDQSNSSFDDYFISKFASITESYLKYSPQLIRNEFSFFISFSKFIFINFSVFSLFKNILANSTFNSYMIYNYLKENHFIDYLFSNLTNESIDLIILCTRIEVFRTASFTNYIFKFDSNELDDKLSHRKWEIISEYTKFIIVNTDDGEKPSLSIFEDFLPFVKKALDHINPGNYEDYLKTQVSALQFLSTMFYDKSLKAENEISNMEYLLEILKYIIIKFPKHTIAINEVFNLVEILITSTSFRSQAIQVFIPLTHKFLMFQKFKNNLLKEEEDSSLSEKSEFHSENEFTGQSQSISFFSQYCLNSHSDYTTDSNSSPTKSQNEDEDDFITISSNNDNEEKSDSDNYEEEVDDEEFADEESKTINEILNPCLRGFAACFLNRLMVHEDNDSTLEKELNESDIFNKSIEYLVEVYNPISESGYGYKNEFNYPNKTRFSTPYLDMKARNVFVLI